jgi:aspartate/glutamate racemase
MVSRTVGVGSIGIIGGAGAFAGVRCARRVFDLAAEVGAVDDRDFPELRLVSLPGLGVGATGELADPSASRAALATAVAELSAAGCDTIGVACNSAHRLELDGVVDLVDATVDATVRSWRGARVAVLSASASRHAGMYRSRFAARGVVVVEPDATQQQMVDAEIAAATATGRCGNLDRVVAGLDADVVVLGCTELDAAAVSNAPTVDSVDVLAAALLARIGERVS